jgi:hypothetical protein
MIVVDTLVSKAFVKCEAIIASLEEMGGGRRSLGTSPAASFGSAQVFG